MTPGALRRALEARQIEWPADPDELPARVETLADAEPGTAAWTSLLLAVELYRSSKVPLPTGLRRDELVRFDGISATWTAHDADGARFLVRAPRHSAPAVHRRLLLRDGRALQGLVPHEEIDGALVAPAWGAPLDGAAVGPLPVLCGGIVALRGWLARGIAPPAPAANEVRVAERRVRIVCLTPGNADFRGWLVPMAHRLRAAGEHLPLLDGLLTLPPATLEEAEQRVRSAMHTHLAERAVDLRTRHLQAGTSDHRARLIEMVERLERSLKPPRGRGAVGFDLDARPTCVVSDTTGVRFGPVNDELPFYTDTFDAAEARRFLRACASAPVNEDLHRDLGTDPAFTEQLSRWVAGGLKLRTVRMLLERT